MNEVELWHHLSKLLPVSVFNRVSWVHERVHWDQVEVAFVKPQGGYHIVSISKQDWLSDLAIARLCLEAP